MRGNLSRRLTTPFCEEMSFEDAFRLLFENATDTILILDIHGKVIAVNREDLQRAGLKLEDLIGRSYKEFVPPEILPKTVKAIKTAANGKPAILELSLKTHTNEEVQVEVTLIPCINDEEIVGVLGIVRDFTEKKEMEEKLRESEERYRNLVETAPEAIYTLSKDGIITSLNPTFQKITGWKTSDWLGKSFKSIIHPDDLSSAVESFQKSLRGEMQQPIELRVLSKQGSYLIGEFISRPLIKEGEAVGEFGIVSDITERKTAEEALRASEAKFRVLFENVPVGVYQSSPEGKILTANPTLVRMLGYDSLSELFAVDITRDLYVKKEDRKAWQQRLEEKDELRNAELVLKRKDGQKLIVLENSHVLRDDSGEVLYYEGTLTDITERKMLEVRLSALNLYSGKLNAANDLQQIYELTLEAMERMLGFENAAFMIEEKRELRVACQRGTPEQCLELPLDGTKKGLTVKAAITRKPVFAYDVRKEEDYAEANASIRSELAVPVEIEDRILGVLDAESSKVGAFDENDAMLLQILASHVATAISNLEKRKENEERSSQMTSLMRSSTEMIRPMDLRKRLEKIAEAIRELGWRRVVIRAVRGSDMEITNPEDFVTAGLSDEEKEFLWSNKVPGQVWHERFGPDYERFKMGEFYYLPWSDPWVRKRFSEGTVSSHLKTEDMIDWDPEDLLYAPLRLADGQIVGMLSIDDPLDGRKPTKDALAPLELFIHQAAVAIENAQLIQQLNDAKDQVKEYANRLELKVKQRTRELEEAQSKLIKAERLAAIGEIAAMVGHDLRNPLTGIAGATYYLRTKSGRGIDDRSKEMLEIIEKDVEYSNKIVNDLLDYSREIRLEPKEATLRSIAKEALSSVRVPDSIRVKDLTKNQPKIKVDPGKLKRVFINLIKNAVDAMPRGGTLTIKSKEKDGKIDIAFIDTGTGMTKEVLRKIWSPLFTTKAKGMGFGLPICRRIVEAHGGSIRVESAAGKGTAFTVTIPIEPQLEGGGNIWVNVPESLLSMMTKR